ncbi:MAG: ATP-binding cassette domain-containing protein [Candidatus Oleimicrobiaceae bacterium]
MNRKGAYRVDNLAFSYQPPNSTGSLFSLQIDSMTLRRGAFAAIVGRSGSGKTTLLSLLGFVRQPKSGPIVLTPTNGADGSEITLTSGQVWRDEKLAEIVRAKYLGYALQAGELLPYLSLLANVEFVLKVLGVKSSKGVARNCLQQLYEKSEEPDLMRTPSSVSQG